VRIDGSTFLITGGGSGLGAATAQVLAASGARILVADVNAEAGEEVASAVEGRFLKTDVTDEASVKAAVAAALELGGPLAGAVNCAGIGGSRLVVGRDGEPYELEPFRRIVEVNLIGTFNVIRLVAAAIAKREEPPGIERGVIVNTASVAAFDGQICQAAYSASKGGVVGMTLPIARDIARHGIRVVTIAPGIFDTPMLGQLPDEIREALAKQVPFPPRLGRPDEYAALVHHIVENEMLNGEVIRLDGSIRMSPR
jgi:NAD(P)-dependent dehydrogenase (short-subunit alcohol dehydrogenase family)